MSSRPRRFELHARVTAGVVVSMCIALCGCGEAALNRGADFYMQQRYIDAAQVFEHAERSLTNYGADDRARYGLYRGATLFALGDTDRARHWLTYSAESVTSSLSTSERLALIEAFLSSARGQPVASSSLRPPLRSSWRHEL
jgi:hypothetical protein